MIWRIWGAGPPLVLLHGDFGSWTHWIRNVLPLARHARVIVPDIPGYGESAMPPEPWSPESLARIMADGADEILGSTTEFCLAGFSFGGIIAGHWAAIRARRIEKLVLLGAGGMGLPNSPLPKLRRLDAEMDAAAAFDVHRHNLATLMFGDADKVDDLAVSTQIENIRQARLRAGGIPASDALLRALPQVQARLYGIWGERDAFAVPYVRDRAEILRRFQPDAGFRIIAGAGHWTPYEAPEAVNAALMDIVGCERPLPSQN